MDDSGVADAFYTVLSIGIVLVAALAVSGVVLSATAGQGKDAGAKLADYGAGREKGLYSFYYAVDEARSDHGSGDPDAIVLSRLAGEGTADAIAFNASTAPACAPDTSGAVIWSGYLYVPEDGAYDLELGSTGAAWMWLDGRMAPPRGPALELTKGYHAFKAKYYYPDLASASCSLSPGQGGRMVTVCSFYR